MKPEYKAYNHIHKLMKEFEVPMLWQRLESGKDDGVPDVFLRTYMFDNWIEFKYITFPKFDKTPITIPFRADQWSWFTRSIKLGLRYWLCVTDLREYYLFNRFSVRDSYVNRIQFDYNTALHFIAGRLKYSCVSSDLYGLFNSEQRLVSESQPMPQHQNLQ